jgi:hypothetical protein
MINKITLEDLKVAEKVKEYAEELALKIIPGLLGDLESEFVCTEKVWLGTLKQKLSMEGRFVFLNSESVVGDYFGLRFTQEQFLDIENYLVNLAKSHKAERLAKEAKLKEEKKLQEKLTEQRKLDPEYQQYLRLQKKFGGCISRENIHSKVGEK